MFKYKELLLKPIEFIVDNKKLIVDIENCLVEHELIVNFSELEKDDKDNFIDCEKNQFLIGESISLINCTIVGFDVEIYNEILQKIVYPHLKKLFDPNIQKFFLNKKIDLPYNLSMKLKDGELLYNKAPEKGKEGFNETPLLLLNALSKMPKMFEKISLFGLLLFIRFNSYQDIKFNMELLNIINVCNQTMLTLRYGKKRESLPTEKLYSAYLNQLPSLEE